MPRQVIAIALLFIAAFAAAGSAQSPAASPAAGNSPKSYRAVSHASGPSPGDGNKVTNSPGSLPGDGHEVAPAAAHTAHTTKEADAPSGAAALKVSAVVGVAAAAGFLFF